jgi:taurine dioxygenase
MKDAAAEQGRIYRSPSGLHITRLQPAIGAEITGIDLTREIPSAAARDIRDALLAHGVIFFRNQAIGYEQHLAFARLFGRPMQDGEDPTRPEVLVVKARGGAKDESANKWHSDGCYTAIPPAISILRAVKVPAFGGDTCFASATAAYEDLSDEMKTCIAPLKYSSSGAFLFKGRKSSFFSQEEWNDRQKRYPEVFQPVVRVHPETGARAIYVNEAQSDYIVGMEDEGGRGLLRYLTDRMKQPEYQVRWRWEPDAIAVWDNRAVQHYGVPNQATDRHMERIMVAGTPPLGIAEWEKTAAK